MTDFSTSVFFHTYMPLQLFSLRNPSYEHIWNWELDVRYTNHYGQLFSNIARYAASHLDDTPHHSPSRYFDTPLYPPTANPPALLTSTRQSPDLITFLPLFNASLTHWVWRKYSIRYGPVFFPNALQATVILTNRLSRALLYKMHEENLAGRALIAEMFPASLALSNNFSHLYFPHPIYFDRVWAPKTIDQVFNHGPNADRGGALAGVVDQEHHFEGSSWYYANRFAPEVYAQWMGWARKGPGSRDWERENGRVCLPGMLLHPIKAESLRPPSR